MPVVISTSSVALQDAILTEYLPDLSAIMLAEGIIRNPITAVVRKGKERFVCDARLAERQAKAISKGQRQKNSLRIAESILDLDHIPNLTRYDRCRICVPQSCPRDCFLRLDCRYQQYLRDSMKPDIQICNHNYLLANASHRLEERPLLLRKYQALVVDEAHKLPDAARQMYTETLSAQNMDDLCSLLQQAHLKQLSKRLRAAASTFCSISVVSRICRTTCNIGWQKQKASCVFFSWRFRRASCTLNFLQTVSLAKALNVRKENFFTRAETPEDIIRTLIWYDWEHGCGGSVPIDTILLFDNFEEVEKLLKEWYSQKEKLRARTITGAKYLEWMLHCPTEKENNKNSQHR